MAFQQQIHINKNGNSVTFDPPVLKANVRDQIFWTNNDTEAHWPGLPAEGENPPNDTFFMPNKIAPGGTSAIFSPGAAFTYNYACSIHPDETGKIEVKGELP